MTVVRNTYWVCNRCAIEASQPESRFQPDGWRRLEASRNVDEPEIVGIDRDLDLCKSCVDEFLLFMEPEK